MSTAFLSLAFVIFYIAIICLLCMNIFIWLERKKAKKSKITFPRTIKTPETIDEAFMQIMMVGPVSEIQERAYMVLKDFIAQKMAAAYLRAGDDPKQLNNLSLLFDSLTKRK